MKLKDLIEQYGEYDVVLSKREATNEIMIEGRKPKPKTIWDLEEREAVFTLNCDGFIEDDTWYDCLDDERDNGNIFLTYEDAVTERERRKVETLLLKHGGHRWFKSGKENWFISFDCSAGLFKSLYTIREHRTGVIYFDTEEQLKKAFEQIGKERIKKALFEVR